MSSEWPTAASRFWWTHRNPRLVSERKQSKRVERSRAAHRLFIRRGGSGWCDSSQYQYRFVNLLAARVGKPSLKACDLEAALVQHPQRGEIVGGGPRQER